MITLWGVAAIHEDIVIAAVPMEINIQGNLGDNTNYNAFYNLFQSYFMLF